MYLSKKSLEKYLFYILENFIYISQPNFYFAKEKRKK